MKTLISKTGQLQILPFVFLLLSFILSGSNLFPQESHLNKESNRDKKLSILQKLESGIEVSSEEITSSYSDFNFEDPEPWEFWSPEINDTPLMHPFPEMNIFPGPFFYKDYKGIERVIISDSDIKDIHKRLSESLEELRKNIESFRNSDDFLIIQDELKKWNESFRKEIERMREDLLQSDSGTRSKGTVQSLM